jgi:DNA (cytosine-5)-methyltransferase 1
LQGFPENFILPKSVTEAHRQFGNSVSINVLQHIIEEIIKTAFKPKKKRQRTENCSNVAI